ncbi:MAG: hypothetical protein LBT23_11935 [Synergistaceae bacterium]|nr:hypothetical protein [Synergistaceae bacterium]
MKKLSEFLNGAASVFDLDATNAKARRYRAMSSLVDTETHKVKVSFGATPSGAFNAVGGHIMTAIKDYEQKYC